MLFPRKTRDFTLPKEIFMAPSDLFAAPLVEIEQVADGIDDRRRPVSGAAVAAYEAMRRFRRR